MRVTDRQSKTSAAQGVDDALAQIGLNKSAFDDGGHTDGHTKAGMRGIRVLALRATTARIPSRRSGRHRESEK
jgi:hypothetical protein